MTNPGRWIEWSSSKCPWKGIHFKTYSYMIANEDAREFDLKGSFGCSFTRNLSGPLSNRMLTGRGFAVLTKLGLGSPWLTSVTPEHGGGPLSSPRWRWWWLFRSCSPTIFFWCYWDSIQRIKALIETNLLWLCLGNVQRWHSLKYDMKLLFLASREDMWNFTMKILYHRKYSITIFDMFKKFYNQETLQC